VHIVEHEKPQKRKPWIQANQNGQKRSFLVKTLPVLKP